MKGSNIRGAALAIVNGTRLVLARGYTWAEPDYPSVQPTTCFRLASVSKLVAALGIHQLVAEGAMPLGSMLRSVLPLTNPNGSAPTNTAYLNGTVGSILHYSGRSGYGIGVCPAGGAHDMAWSGDDSVAREQVGIPFGMTVRKVACATNQQTELHLCAIGQADGLWNTVRLANGNWPYPWGDVRSVVF
jgi:Beta-lactamase